MNLKDNIKGRLFEIIFCEMCCLFLFLFLCQVELFIFHSTSVKERAWKERSAPKDIFVVVEELLYLFSPCHIFLYIFSILQTFCAACHYIHAGGEPRVVEDLHKEWVEGRCRQPPIITYLEPEN